jgi:putative membrane protein
MIIVWAFGLLMSVQLGLFNGLPGLGWLHAKILFVVLLTGFHGYLIAQTKKVAKGQRPLSEKQLRMIGELPGLLLVIIVILVVVFRAM